MVDNRTHEHTILCNPAVHHEWAGTDNVGPHPLMGFLFGRKAVDLHNGLNVGENAGAFADVGHNLSKRVSGEAVPSYAEVIVVQRLKVADGNVNAA